MWKVNNEMAVDMSDRPKRSTDFNASCAFDAFVATGETPRKMANHEFVAHELRSRLNDQQNL